MNQFVFSFSSKDFISWKMNKWLKRKIEKVIFPVGKIQEIE